VTGPLQIGGAPPVTLEAEAFNGPGFTTATVLPGRGMMLLQARLRLPDGRETDALFAPNAAEAAAQLDGGEEDFAGSKGFAFGGAILAPYANRIRGRALGEVREIETQVGGQTVRLPRNWGGKAPGAEQYAMHGLILDAPVPYRHAASEWIAGRLRAGDFGGRWASQTDLAFEWRLAGGALMLAVVAKNLGHEPLPIGIGWHPYFALPSGDRAQARLRLPAQRRVEVNDYDEVLPTGRLVETGGSAYDFAGPTGAALGDLYLDDCFTDLMRDEGEAVVEVLDPAAGVGLRITSPSPHVKAIQVYAPPDKAFVVVEPQYNLADPFGAVWPEGCDTGMVWLQPGQTSTYSVRVTAFALGTA
jgi:aldose 1-epimerase